MPGALSFRLVVGFTVGDRTLVYRSLTAKLTLTYFEGAVATQHLFRALTGQEDQPNSP
jgi:hypothetical protein